MEFCKNCRSILQQREGKTFCSKCGITKQKITTIILTEEIKSKDNRLVVAEEQQNLPTTQEKCPKCDNDKAYFYTRQLLDGDEPETEFYKCARCGHGWRVN